MDVDCTFFRPDGVDLDVARGIENFIGALTPAHSTTSKRYSIKKLLREHVDQPLQAFFLRCLHSFWPQPAPISQWESTNHPGMGRAIKAAWFMMERGLSPTSEAAATFDALVELGLVLDNRPATRDRRRRAGFGDGAEKDRTRRSRLELFEHCEHCPEYTQRYALALADNRSRFEGCNVLLHSEIDLNAVYRDEKGDRGPSARFCCDEESKSAVHTGGKTAAARYRAFLGYPLRQGGPCLDIPASLGQLRALFAQHGVEQYSDATRRRVAHFLSRPESGKQLARERADRLDHPACIRKQREFVEYLLREGGVHTDLFPLFSDRVAYIHVHYQNPSKCECTSGVVDAGSPIQLRHIGIEHVRCQKPVKCKCTFGVVDAGSPIRLRHIDIEHAHGLHKSLRQIAGIPIAVAKRGMCIEIPDAGMTIETNGLGRDTSKRTVLTVHIERGYQYRWVADYLTQQRSESASRAAKRRVAARPLKAAAAEAST